MAFGKAAFGFSVFLHDVTFKRGGSAVQKGA
jgi:hypothetical protein